jgi:hypothetical protein
MRTTKNMVVGDFTYVLYEPLFCEFRQESEKGAGPIPTAMFGD